eukprot:TRINITY_DN1504_c0_g1_i4.p1 TRINITY_DN1504_c0_g1~~TRINITY_DN1504_c0_g1_i4.p1  ORF type:complete len:598 (-),score=66.91 TRINITY_DN1504_c0_g1_i4:1276-3069(-)
MMSSSSTTRATAPIPLPGVAVPLRYRVHMVDGEIRRHDVTVRCESGGFKSSGDDGWSISTPPSAGVLLRDHVLLFMSCVWVLLFLTLVATMSVGFAGEWYFHLPPNHYSRCFQRIYLPSPSTAGVAPMPVGSLRNGKHTWVPGSFLPFYHQAQKYKDSETLDGELNVTIATQLTVDRVKSFLLMCAVWRGPVSAVVYVRDTDDLAELNRVRRENQPFLDYVDFHIWCAKSPHERYPVNHLRNRGVECARTHRIIQVDADFVPNRDLRLQINQIISDYVNSRLVVDLFQPTEQQQQQQHEMEEENAQHRPSPRRGQHFIPFIARLIDRLNEGRRVTPAYIYEELGGDDSDRTPTRSGVQLRTSAISASHIVPARYGAPVAFVVPSFELSQWYVHRHNVSVHSVGSVTDHGPLDSLYPLNKCELVSLHFDWRATEGQQQPQQQEAKSEQQHQGNIHQVHYFKGRRAHLPTDYDRWYSYQVTTAAATTSTATHSSLHPLASSITSCSLQPNTHEGGGDSVVNSHVYEVEYDYLYEPYVVVDRRISPRYDERFIGYGNDKSAHTYELVASGHRLAVLPHSFLIHQDHGVPAWRKDQGSVRT